MEYIYNVMRFSYDMVKYEQKHRKDNLFHEKATAGMSSYEKRDYYHNLRVVWKSQFKNPTVEFLLKEIERIKTIGYYANHSGSFASYEEARKAVIDNSEYIHEGWYPILCIEKKPFSVIDDYSLDEPRWFRYDKEEQVYKRCKKPSWTIGYLSWS